MYFMFPQDEPYPMNKPNIGHAVIINNLWSEQKSTQNDVKAMSDAFTQIGFQVQIHKDCSSWVITLVHTLIIQIIIRIHSDLGC